MALSPAARRRLAGAWTEVHALAALDELARMIDPAGERGRWWAAGELAARLRRFESVAYRRITRGGRAPSGRLEALLLVILRSNLPTSRRRLFDLLN